MLDDEVEALGGRLDQLTSTLVPGLRQRLRVGQEVAAALVVTTGLGGGRIRSEASFSMRVRSLANPGFVESHRPASSRPNARHRIARVGMRSPRPRCGEVAKWGPPKVRPKPRFSGAESARSLAEGTSCSSGRRVNPHRRWHREGARHLFRH